MWWQAWKRPQGKRTNDLKKQTITTAAENFVKFPETQTTSYLDICSCVLLHCLDELLCG